MRILKGESSISRETSLRIWDIPVFRYRGITRQEGISEHKFQDLVAEGERGQLNCAEKKDYRRSFLLHVVYYRQSWQGYLAKNCADNATGPITRRSDVE